jgi:hypothetical protein
MKSALAHVLELSEEAHAETVGRLATYREKRSIDQDDRVATWGHPHRADTAAGKYTSLKQRLRLVHRQIDVDQLNRVSQGDIAQTQIFDTGHPRVLGERRQLYGGVHE